MKKVLLLLFFSFCTMGLVNASNEAQELKDRKDELKRDMKRYKDFGSICDMLFFLAIATELVSTIKVKDYAYITGALGCVTFRAIAMMIQYQIDEINRKLAVLKKQEIKQKALKA